VATKLRSHLTFRNVVSSLCLFVVLGGGTAWALTRNSVGSAELKPNAVKNSDISDDAVKSPQVADGSLLGRDFAAGTLPAGPQGEPGPEGPAGGFTDSLPSGAVTRGTYTVTSVATSAGQEAETNLAFPFAIAAAPTAHFVALGASVTAACPGSALAPTAAAGNLCIYEADRGGLVASVTPFDPSQAKAPGAGKASRFGFGLRVVSDGAGGLRSSGTWAVRAP
jgi:hypothetical protein